MNDIWWLLIGYLVWRMSQGEPLIQGAYTRQQAARAARKAIEITGTNAADLLDKLDKIQRNGKRKVLAILAGWCPYCTKFKQNNFGGLPNMIDVDFYWINLGDNRESKDFQLLARTLKIERFPTIVFAPEKGSPKVYGGGTDPSAIASAVREYFV